MELAASLTVLAIGIVGVIGVMNGSFRVAVNASARSKAIAVATQEIEELRGSQYEDIAVPDPTAPATSYSETVDGRTFTVTRTVEWADEATGASPTQDAYKKAIVEVRWQESDGVKFVHQETLIYPGGLGQHASVATTTPNGNGNPLAPSNLLATIPTNLVGTTGVDLVWTPPASSNPEPVTYVVQYSTDLSFTTYQEVTDSVPALNPFLRVTDLAPSTTYHFRVASKAANGHLSSSWATTYNVTTPASLALGCTLGDATATPQAVKKRNAVGQLEFDILVNLNGIGLSCSSTTLRAEYSPVAGTTVVKPLTRSGSIWSGTIDGRNTVWSVGAHDVKIYDSTNAHRATINVIICEKGKATCP